MIFLEPMFFIIFLKFCFWCTEDREIDTAHISATFPMIAWSCLQWQSAVGPAFKLRRPRFKYCFPLKSCVTLGKLLMSRFFVNVVQR